MANDTTKKPSPRGVTDKIYFSLKRKTERHQETEHKVSHILFLCDKPRRYVLPKLNKLILNTRKHPIDQRQWVVHFTDINSFLSEAIAEAGVWIVAESKALAKLVLSALFISKGKSLREAVSAVPYFQRTPLNEELFLQLQIWHAMKGEFDKNFTLWKSYNDQCKIPTSYIGSRVNTTNVTTTTSKIEKIKKLHDEQNLNLFSFSCSGAHNWGYCCKTCKARLLTNTNIVGHNTTTEFQPVLSKEFPCKRICVEPLRWMQIIEETSGTLYCYSCATPVGTWDWESIEQCSQCEQPFLGHCLLNVSALTFIEPPTQTSTTSSKRKSFSGNFWSLLSSGGVTKRKSARSRSKSRGAEHTQHYASIIANQYENLPKPLQKEIIRSKLSPRECDANWYITQQVFLFVSKVYIYSQKIPTQAQPDTKVEGAEDVIPIHDTQTNINCLVRGIKEFAKGSTFQEQFEQWKNGTDKDNNLRRPLDHPLIKSFVTYSDEFWKPCNVPYVNTNIPNYIELTTVTFLNSNNPRKLFKLESQSSGKGGYGKVYTAKCIETGEKVAVKKMKHSTSIEMEKNFKEVAILSAAVHPNIAKYYDCFKSDDELWLVMESLGGTLSELQIMGHFNETRIAYIAKECLKGLKHLHSIGLVHRDIKPSNIMFTSRAKVKIIDFGLCEMVQTVAENPKISGSPYWIPPETLLVAPQTTKADIWSLGCTLLQLTDPNAFVMGTTFRTLFTVAKSGRAECIDNLAKHSGKLGLSNEYIDFLQCMLHKDPGERLSADMLLKHPFLKKKLSSSLIADYVHQLIVSKSVFKS